MIGIRHVRIGLISDTHGLLRPEAISFLHGCDAIVHAGDVCDPSVLDRLASIAPVHAVRGNNDRGAWADALPVSRLLAVDGLALFVIHDVADLETHRVPAGATMVVHGHSHKPTLVERDGLVFINPGSAGPRRFRLPVSVGEVIVDEGFGRPRLVTLID